MNWSHSGAIFTNLGYVWVVAAILVVADVSTEVWLACGVVGISLAIASGLQAERRRRTVSRQFMFFSYRSGGRRSARVKSETVPHESK